MKKLCVFMLAVLICLAICSCDKDSYTAETIIVEVTDTDGNVVTDDEGNAVTEIITVEDTESLEEADSTDTASGAPDGWTKNY